MKKKKNMKTIDKIYLVVLLVTGILLVTSLASCKSTKSGCDAYGSLNERKNYTIKVEHCHIEEENYCYYTLDTIFKNN
jgi:hypothetical protein